MTKNNVNNTDAAKVYLESKVYLKVEKFEELAHELLKVKRDLQLMRSISETFPKKMSGMSGRDLELQYYRAKNTFELFSDKFHDMEIDLEEVSNILYSVDDYQDLKEFVHQEDMNTNN